MKKKKKEYTFFWEQPLEQAKEIKDLFSEPFEFKFTVPKFTFPEIRFEKTIPVNVAETGAEIIIKAEVPGYKKTEININVTENTIEISAFRKREKTEKTKGVYSQEKSAGAVKRAFTLPANVDPAKAEAKLEEGILAIILPKLYPDQKRRRRLEIK